MDSLSKFWRSLPASFRKPFIFTVGVLVVIIGIILLPLPGPGWVIIFLGFAILATEFKRAEQAKNGLVSLLKQVIKKAQAFWRSIKR